MKDRLRNIIGQYGLMLEGYGSSVRLLRHERTPDTCHKDLTQCQSQSTLVMHGVDLKSSGS
jgi:hypothetical protein